MSTTLSLRRIEARDNAAVAHIIRTVMTEFGAVGEGYSIMDPEVDHMFEAYQDDRAAYYVILDGDTVLGCGGIARLRGGDEYTCELKKMYFLPAARGTGMGSRLMDQLIVDAQALGFHTIYLETLARMEAANILYRKAGFTALTGPMGNTGHTSCGMFYAKKV